MWGWERASEIECVRERDRESVRNNFGRLKPDVSFVVASALPWSSFFIFQERNRNTKSWDTFRDLCRGAEKVFKNASPVWPNLAKFHHNGKFCQYKRACFSIDNISNVLWQYLFHWANFHCCKWPNTEKIIQPSCHTEYNKNRTFCCCCSHSP